MPPRPELVWPVSRVNESGLIANLAMWLALLSASAAACQRLPGRYQPRLGWRPRLTTLIILLAVAAPTVLANMTVELSYASTFPLFGTARYGWPLAWHWYWVAPFEANVYGRDFSAARLAGNIAIWLAMLVAAALPCEWLLRHYQPRFRFSMRTMLAAVALFAVLCAWSIAVWKRADEQDAVAASVLTVYNLRVTRVGPKWLRFVVPDRYRRCLVGASISFAWRDETEDEQDAKDNHDDMQDREEWDGNAHGDEPDPDEELTAEEWEKQEEEVLQRLVGLRDLRYLSVGYGRLTPAMNDALTKLQQLKSLDVGGFIGWTYKPTNLAWIGHLRQLEQLSLTRVASDELGFLANLTRLKSLTLDLSDCIHDESEMNKRLAAVGKLTQLRRLRLQGSPGAQIARLSGLTNLKSLAIDFHHFDRDQERLRQCFAAIGTLTQVELLRLVTPTGPLKVCADNLASLGGMQNLRTLWLLISCDKSERQACLAAIAKLTQLRRLWLLGDVLTTGVAELAPLQSLEELLISDPAMETPAAIESLSVLKGLKAVDIPALAFDYYSNDEAGDARRAFKSFQRSHPGRVSNLWLEWQNEPGIDWQGFEDKPPDLDSFLGGIPMVGA